MYQLKKLAVRHKLPSALIGLLLILVSGFALWMSVLYSRASRAEERAVTEAKTATAVKDFLVTEMLASAQPEVAQGSNITVEEVLASASERIGEAFADQPLIEAAIRVAIGQSYVSLGLYDSAEPHLRAAEALRARELGDEHPETLRSRTILAAMLYRKAAYREAGPLAEETLETSRRVLGEEHEITLEAAYQWARLLWVQGKLSASQELQRHTLEVRRRVLGDEHPDTLVSLNQWGLEGLVHNADMAEAEDLFREALDISRRTLGEAHPETLKAMANLGFALMLKRELPEANALLSEAFDAHHRVLGGEHPDTLICTLRLGLLRKEQDRIDEAEALYEGAWETSRRLLGDEHPITRNAMQYLGFTLLRHGKSAEAAGAFRELLEIWRRVEAIDHESNAHSLNGLSIALLRLGRCAEAERGHREALVTDRRVLGNEHLNTVWSMRCLIDALTAHGKEDEARPLAEELLELRRTVAEVPDADAYKLNCYARELLTVYPADLRDPKRGLEVALQAFEMSSDAYHYNRYTLARAYEMNGDLDHAVELARRALAHIPVEYSRERVEYEEALVRILEVSEDDTAAQAVYRNTLAQRREQFPKGHLDIAESLVRLGEILIRHGKFDEAETYLREAVEIRENALDEGDWHIGEAMSLLGASLAGRERSAEAEPLLVNGFTVLVDSPMAYSSQTRLALERIEDFLGSANRSEEIPDYVAMLPDRMGLEASAIP